ncbi:MAG: hypothetical protein K1X53_11325 [Candidatus Sumerlaeaceae bacterium]|nr:hypothetical protein [Candidatus Sumerlaeaceae bacterium]
MQCPYCQTENREDRDHCYCCERDLAMLRVIVNKARHHYNLGLEHAERGRNAEAIEEFRNAIDLDRRFAPAHVVLGTLYARQNDFHRANECWKAALAINPDLNKAHAYLAKAEQVAVRTPVIRRLRLYCGVLAGLLVLVLLGFMYAMRPDRVNLTLQEAIKAYEAENLNTALTMLHQMRERKSHHSSVNAAASALREAIKSELRQQVQSIQEMKYREDYPAALAAISALESREPDPGTSATLAAIKQDINHYYAGRIEGLYKNFTDGAVSYPELAARVDEYLKVYPDLPDKEGLRSYLERAREVESGRRVEQILTEFRDQRDVQQSLEDLQQLSAQFPGMEAVKKGRADLVEAILNYVFERFQESMDEGNYDQAATLLREINSLASEFRDIVDVTGPVELAQRVLIDAEKTGRLKEVELLMKSASPAGAQLALMDIVSDDSLTTAERELVGTYLIEINRRNAAEELRQIVEKQSKYLTLQISDEEASFTLARYQEILDALPKSSAAERNALIACAAVSAFKLNQKEEADALAAMLEANKADRNLYGQLQRLFKRKR